MGKQTGIEWARSSRNFWTGCTQIGPGCDGCYARGFNLRLHGGANWGAGAPRVPHLAGAAADLQRWERQAAAEQAAGGAPWRVFVNSHSDFFDNEVPPAWRDQAWDVMRRSVHLTFLLLTKRAGNIGEMLPADWGCGYPNVWLGATVCTQTEADRDVPKLLRVPARLRFLSCEPLLERLDIGVYLRDWCGICGGYGWAMTARCGACDGTGLRAAGSIDWVIVGGETHQMGHAARPFVVEDAANLLKQCKDEGVPAFVKQLGSRPVWGGGVQWFCTGSGNDPDEWPDGLRVRQFPDLLPSIPAGAPRSRAGQGAR